MKEFVLAADLGGTNLRMASVSADGEMLYRVKEAIPESRTKEEIVASICRMAKECIDNTDGVPLSIALAVPGIVDTMNGFVYRAPNLPDLNQFAISQEIEKHLSIRVLIENDANAAAIGEVWKGSAIDTQNAIMVTLGTGVGGGIIINGEILRGIDGTAGEVGHINVEPDGLECGCGSFGCVEQYSSATAVARYGNQIHGGIDGNGGAPLTSEDIFERAKNGEEWALSVFQRQGKYLGLALAGLLNCLNPEVIVFGGGAAGAWEFFVPALKEQLKKSSYREPALRAKIKRSELGDDAGIMGVAKLGLAWRVSV